MDMLIIKCCGHCKMPSKHFPSFHYILSLHYYPEHQSPPKNLIPSTLSLFTETIYYISKTRRPNTRMIFRREVWPCSDTKQFGLVGWRFKELRHLF